MAGVFVDNLLTTKTKMFTIDIGTNTSSESERDRFSSERLSLFGLRRRTMKALPLLFLVGCVTIPENNELRKISRGYIPNVYDCSNMGARYTRYLKSKGYYTSLLIVENVETSNVHCIVQVLKGRVNLYIDPTTCSFINLDDWIILRVVDKYEMEISSEFK